MCLAKGLSTSSGPQVDAGVEKHHHIGLLLVLPFLKLFLFNVTDKNGLFWDIFYNLVMYLFKMMLSQWRTNMTKVWYAFLQDGYVNDCQGHRCKICVQSHVCPACSVSVLLTSNVHTDCKTVKTTLQDFHKTILQKHFSRSRKQQSGNIMVWDEKQHIAR